MELRHLVIELLMMNWEDGSFRITTKTGHKQDQVVYSPV